MMGNEEAWDILLRMKRDDRLSRVPVIVISTLSEREKAAALGADVYLPKPIDRRLLLETLESVNARATPIRVLAIDDDEAIRFLIRQCLAGPYFEVREALSGEDGLAMAQKDPPDVILLDLLMPGVDGYASPHAAAEGARNPDRARGRRDFRRTDAGGARRRADAGTRVPAEVRRHAPHPDRRRTVARRQSGAIDATASEAPAPPST